MSRPSIPQPVNCLPQRLPLFLCLRGMGHVTSPFTAMDAGCIHFRKRRLRWCFFISIRRLERFARSKPSPPYRRGLREQPSPQRSFSRLMGIFYTQPTGCTIRSRSSALNSEGRLHYLGETSTMGDYPRHIQMDPGGSFLYACNQRSDSIASFRVDRKTGLLTFTGKYTSVGSPACTLFLE